MSKLRTNNSHVGSVHEVDDLVEVYLTIPKWMRDELRVRAIRAGMKRDHYIRSLFLAALGEEKVS